MVIHHVDSSEHFVMKVFGRCFAISFACSAYRKAHMKEAKGFEPTLSCEVSS